MLKLLVFAACEKVIISEEGTASVISVMESVRVKPLPGLAANALAPIRWNILSLWHREREVQAPIDYEERTEVFMADGTVIGGGLSNFTVTNDNVNYRTVLRLDVFPIGLAGTVVVKLSLREVNAEWREIAEYPITVVHEAPEENEEAPAVLAANPDEMK